MNKRWRNIGLTALLVLAIVVIAPAFLNGGNTQQDDIPGAVRFQTYERLAAEVNNDSIRWAYLP